MTFSERFLDAFGNASTSEIARKLGITYQAVKNYVDGRIPQADTLVQISRTTNVSIHWLVTGEGAKLLGENSFPGDVKNIARPPDGVNNARRLTPVLDIAPLREISLPLVGLISAEQLIPLEQESVMVPSVALIDGVADVVVLRVSGDDLADESLSNGDLLICVPAESAESGQLVVALLDDKKPIIARYHRFGFVVTLTPRRGQGATMEVPAESVTVKYLVQKILLENP